MNHESKVHLSYDEQLKAIIDISDLTTPCRQHLESCDACRAEMERIERRYRRLGEMAEALAPAPRHPYRLPRNAGKPARRQLRTLWAAGAVGALVLIMLMWWPHAFKPKGGGDQYVAQHAVDDRHLMVEIDALIENALPAPYREMAAAIEHGPNFDEDLINWIVPSIEEDDSIT